MRSYACRKIFVSRGQSPSIVCFSDRPLGIAVLLAAFAPFVHTSPAQAQLKGYDDSFSDATVAVVVDIDPATGLGSVPPEFASCTSGANPPNTVFGVNFTSGYAFIDGVLYGLEWNGGSGPDIFLYTLAASFCGTGTRVSASPVGLTNLESLAYCTADGFLYSVDFSFGGHEGRLIRIDPTTGAGTVVGTAMTRDIRIVGMTYDPTVGLLIGITSAFGDRTAPELVTIDPQTGVIQDIVGMTGAPANSFESLTRDTSGPTPRLLAAGTKLSEINRATGAATEIGGNYNGAIWALAAPPPSGMETPTPTPTPMPETSVGWTWYLYR